ncbi:MAG: hypothetical protein ACLTER_17900 [Ruminococcus sp.]
MQLIDQYREWDREQLEENKKTAATALENFKSILELICSFADNPNPKLHSVRNLFYSSIAFLFNEIEPKTVGSFLPYLHDVKTGEEFSSLVSKTYNWFKIHQKEWALPNIQEYIPDDTYTSAKEVLKRFPMYDLDNAFLPMGYRHPGSPLFMTSNPLLKNPQPSPYTDMISLAH